MQNPNKIVEKMDDLLNLIFWEREPDKDQEIYFNKIKHLHKTLISKENDNYFLELTEGISLKSIFQEQLEFIDNFPLLFFRKKALLIYR